MVGTVAAEICYWKNANTQKKRNLVQGEIKLREEENRQADTVPLGTQGACLRWETKQLVRYLTVLTIPALQL